MRRPHRSYDFLLEKDSLAGEYLDRSELTSLLERHRNGSEDATDRIWNLLNLQVWGDTFLNGRRARWDGGMFPAAESASRGMKILWVKTDFLHPTDRGGQIRTLGNAAAAAPASMKFITSRITIPATAGRCARARRSTARAHIP